MDSNSIFFSRCPNFVLILLVAFASILFTPPSSAQTDFTVGADVDSVNDPIITIYKLIVNEKKRLELIGDNLVLSLSLSILDIDKDNLFQFMEHAENSLISYRQLVFSAPMNQNEYKDMIASSEGVKTMKLLRGQEFVTVSIQSNGKNWKILRFPVAQLPMIAERFQFTSNFFLTLAGFATKIPDLIPHFLRAEVLTEASDLERWVTSYYQLSTQLRLGLSSLKKASPGEELLISSNGEDSYDLHHLLFYLSPFHTGLPNQLVPRPRQLEEPEWVDAAARSLSHLPETSTPTASDLSFDANCFSLWGGEPWPTSTRLDGTPHPIKEQ